MKKNVKMAIGDAETVQEIEEYMQKIHDRYGCYVEFQYSCSFSFLSEGDSYDEKWTISTPFTTPFTTSNNSFETSDKLIAYMKYIAEDKDGWALKHYKRKLIAEKRSLEEDQGHFARALKDVEEKLARLNEM